MNSVATPSRRNDGLRNRGYAESILPQGPAIVHRDMIGGVAADLELRVVGRAVPGVTLPLEVADMHLDDRAADTTGFRVPADVVADCEACRHRRADAVADDSTACARRQTSSTLKPNSRRFTSPGADAPKRSRPSTSPASPT